jgi:hypothetical protein
MFRLTCSTTEAGEVRFREHTGKHLLSLSFTGFDRCC